MVWMGGRLGVHTGHALRRGDGITDEHRNDTHRSCTLGLVWHPVDLGVARPRGGPGGSPSTRPATILGSPTPGVAVWGSP